MRTRDVAPDEDGVPVKRALALAALTLTSLVSLPAMAYEDPDDPEPAPHRAMIVEPARVPPMPPPTPKYPARFELKVAGGVTTKNLFGLPMTMGTFDLGMGAKIAPMIAFNVNLDGDFGKTTRGLTTRVYTLAPAVEVVFDRLRVAFGVEALWFGIARATTRSVIAHGGLGARLGASVDLLKTEPVTLFIGGRGQADWLFAGGLLSATGQAGLRF